MGKPDGREHKIDVKVTRAGLKVRHRGEFRDRTTEEQRDGRLLAALRFGGAGNPLGVRLEIDAAQAADGGVATVPVRIVVPAAKPALPRRRRRRPEPRISISRSRRATSRAVCRRCGAAGHGRARQDRGPIDAAQLRFPIDVRLRKGQARVAAVVRDLSAQTESLVWAEVAVR